MTNANQHISVGKPFCKAAKGFVYWLLTKGPIGVALGTILKHRVFDRLGPVSVPQTTKPDTISAIVCGIYEYPERLLINRWLPRDLDCIELGCSIGVISRVILQKLNIDYKLFALEASEALLALAKSNVAAAGFATRFESINNAVHYHGDHVIFDEHEDHICGKVATREKASGTPIPCTTLSRVIKSNSLRMYSLVMDIEGSEFDVITKDSESLLHCQTIIVEVHGDAQKRAHFIDCVSKCGFKLVEVKHSVFAFVRTADVVLSE